MTPADAPEDEPTRALSREAAAGADAGGRHAGSAALPLGLRLGEFEIQRVLGEGGFGIVYLARDLQLERPVAIKEYMPGSIAARQPDLSVAVTSERHRDTFELGRRSFINEARLLAHFDHPALVKVFRFWEERGTAYMTMPYYHGQTLKQWLRARGAPPGEDVLRELLEPVLDALGHLHERHCFHRDIAPDNILMLDTGTPLLIDFGAARQVVADKTQALTVILKPGYAPIEQYAESPSMKQGAWTDLYALAAVCHYAITGRAPPPAVARLVTDDMPRLAEVARGRYGAAFLEALDACLAVRSFDRPQSVAEVRRRLAVAGVIDEPVREPPAPAPPGPRAAVPPERDLDPIDMTRHVALRRPAPGPAPRSAGFPAAPRSTGSPAAPWRSASAESLATPAAGAAAKRRWRWIALAIVAIVLALAGGWFAWSSAHATTAPATPPNADACTELLQQMSAGADSPALRDRMRQLDCR